MPSKRRKIQRLPASTAQPPTAAACLPASAVDAVVQATHAAQAAAATSVMQTVPTLVAAPPLQSAAVITPPPPRELLPGHSWWDWMPPTVRRRLLVLAGIDPDASRWGTLPYEIQLMILKAAGPLTLFLNGLLGDKSSLKKATIHALWTEAITQDWQGDLDLLPDVNFYAGEVDDFESDPSVGMRSLSVSRPMYDRLCYRFPDQASADDDNAALRNHYETDIFRPPDLFTFARLRHVPMRNCWFDLVDFSYPIDLGWKAIRFGFAGLLKHLVEHHGVDLGKFQSYDEWMAMDLAAWSGHLDILQMLHDAGNTWCSYRAMDVAATRGFLHVVQFLHANRTEGCTPKAMDRAALNGHLDIVRWLHANRTEGCTTGAMDRAAAFGRLDVIKWLNANRTEGCTADAMDSAAVHGHLNVVKWLHANRTEGCTVDAMDSAARNGHLDVVKWLHSNRTEGCTEWAMDYAAGHGHLDIVQWLHANRTERCTTKAMDRAARNGHLDIVQWLHANRTEGCSANAIDDAVGNGHLDVAQFLVAYGCPFTFRALRGAKNDAVVDFLLDSLPLARVLKLLRKARRKGGCPILAERLKHAVSKKKESAAAQ